MSLWKRLLGVAIAEDEALNAALGPGDVPAAGNPHFTVSQRLAEMRKRGSKIGCIGCAVLTWIQNKVFRVPGDHCTNALAGFPDIIPTDG